MNVTLVGISHRTAPIEIRERMNIQESRLAAALSNLVSREGIREGLILSTCNRVDLAASAEEGAEVKTLLRGFLSDYHRYDVGAYDRYLYWLNGREVVRHLFRVAASLDSMVLGEPQILGQLKQAYRAAREAGALGGTLHEITEQALAVGRRVRRETALGTTAVSVSYAAVELAKKIFGSLEGKTIFVVGAGKMSELAAKHLLSSGASAILVTNRTYPRAVQLADAFHGTAIQFDRLFDYVDQADIIISSTGAPHFIVTKDR